MYNRVLKHTAEAEKHTPGTSTLLLIESRTLAIETDNNCRGCPTPDQFTLNVLIFKENKGIDLSLRRIHGIF